MPDLLLEASWQTAADDVGRTASGFLPGGVNLPAARHAIPAEASSASACDPHQRPAGSPVPERDSRNVAGVRDDLPLRQVMQQHVGLPLHYPIALATQRLQAGAILADIGFEAKFFDDGYTALDAVRRTPPDLVITEVLVPRLGGLSLVRLIKGDTSLERTKVLVLSSPTALDRALESGADAFLQKPLERIALGCAVTAIVAAPGEEVDCAQGDGACQDR